MRPTAASTSTTSHPGATARTRTPCMKLVRFLARSGNPSQADPSSQAGAARDHARRDGPQRRHAGVRARRHAVRLGGRRRRRAGPGEAHGEALAPRRARLVVRDPGRQSLHRPGRPPWGDLGLRPAQPLALLLRQADGRPLDRRRRPSELGGGRLPACGHPRRGELWLALLRGHARRDQRDVREHPVAPAVARVSARFERRTDGHRRLRLSRQPPAVPVRLVPVRRLVLREALDARRRRRGRPWRSRTPR